MPKLASLCRRDADRVTSRYKNPFWLEGVQIITRIALVTYIDYPELLLINQNMHMLLLITTNDQIHSFELWKFINRILCKPIFMNLSIAVIYLVGRGYEELLYFYGVP